MKCEFDYCIYNRDFSCILSDVTINSFGMCDECIIVSLDKEFLESEKVRQFKELEKRWKKDGFTTGIDRLFDHMEAKAMVEPALRMIGNGVKLDDVVELLELTDEQVGWVRESERFKANNII